MGRNLKLSLTAALSLVIVGCQNKSDDSSSTAEKTLYVAAGLCYSGVGVTTYSASTASRAVTKWSTSSGSYAGLFTDLNVGSNVSTDTVPQSLLDRGDHILMLTENATTMGDRKIFKIMKDNPGTYITYGNDPNAFTATGAHITRSMALAQDGSILFSKSVALERLNGLVRIPKVTGVTPNPWVDPAGATGNCATAGATLIPQVAVLPPFTGASMGKTIYLHAGATAALNRIAAAQRTGLATTVSADCAGASPAGGLSTVTHVNAGDLIGPVTFNAAGTSPTSMVLIPTPSPATTTAKMLVTYSSGATGQLDNTTTFNHGVVVWDVNETSDSAVTFTNPTILYRNESVVFAASAMAYDPSTSSLYVAVGPNPGLVSQMAGNYGYNIEKFTLNLTTPSLTRVSPDNKPFIIGNAQTKCISDMKIGD